MLYGFVDNVDVAIKNGFDHDTAHVKVDFYVSRIVLDKFLDSLIPADKHTCEPIWAIVEHSIQEDQ